MIASAARADDLTTTESLPRGPPSAFCITVARMVFFGIASLSCIVLYGYHSPALRTDSKHDLAGASGRRGSAHPGANDVEVICRTDSSRHLRHGGSRLSVGCPSCVLPAADVAPHTRAWSHSRARRAHQ